MSSTLFMFSANPNFVSDWCLFLNILRVKSGAMTRSMLRTKKSARETSRRSKTLNIFRARDIVSSMSGGVWLRNSAVTECHNQSECWVRFSFHTLGIVLYSVHVQHYNYLCLQNNLKKSMVKILSHSKYRIVLIVFLLVTIPITKYECYNWVYFWVCYSSIPEYFYKISTSYYGQMYYSLQLATLVSTIDDRDSDSR